MLDIEREATSGLLFLTHLIVASLPMDEEDGEVGDVEIGDWGIESGRQGPRKGHKKVATKTHEHMKDPTRHNLQVIWVPRATPPS